MRAINHGYSVMSRDELVRKSLKYSILDGSFAASMIGFGESFFPAYAVFLKANNIQFGLLTSLPLLLGSLVQLLSHGLLRHFHSRKKLVSSMALSQGIMYLPVILVFFLGSQRVTFLILFACVYWIFGMILSPAWNSWMGDLVDEKQRGDYFGRRSKITGASSFFAFLAAGFILHLYPEGTATEYLGYVTIFLLAFSSRIFSYVFLTKKYDPPFETPPRPEFSFFEFIREARFRNYGRFVLYLSFMNFSVYLAAPFFTPYMLKDLQLDYMTFTIVNASAIVVKFLSMPVWGRVSDQYGTRKVLSLSGILMPVVPVLWIFSGSMYYLILIQILAGFIWAGFELSSLHFIFDTTTPVKRPTAIAYYNVLNGICLFAGSMAGALLVKYNSLFWSKYLLVFVLSGILRGLASYVFIPKLKEVRIVESIPYSSLFFKIIRTMPTIGVIYSFIPLKGGKKRGGK
jgi:MFS family permease